MTWWEISDSENSWDRTLFSEPKEIPIMKTSFEAQIEHFVKGIKSEKQTSCDGEEA